MVAGLELPTEGQIRIQGRDVTYAEPRHRDIAMAFQDYGLYPHLSVFQNIEFPLKVRKVAAAERKRKVEEVAEKMGIHALLSRKPGQISGGQRQRVSLARALVRNPRVFLMDEPLSNLDAKLRAIMRTEIKKLVSSLGITTIYVTHDQIEAMSMADRIAVMKDGEMVQIAPPIELYSRPRTQFVAEFVGSPAMNLLPARMSGSRIESSLKPLGDLVPEAERRLAGDRVTSRAFYVGIRPEHLSLTAPGQGHFDATVDLVEPLGQTTNVHLTCGDTRMVAVVDSTTAKTGERVGLDVETDHLRLVAA
jgi:multiple sugar transport system ATP-binding protein